MKKIVLFLTLTFSCLISFGQCLPISLYQDSISGTWPDTIQNLPHLTQGVAYYSVIDIKTPATLIEAANGDSTLTTIDTLGNTYYIGTWPVDSMILVQINGLPSGLTMDCNTGANCSFPGDVVGCANVFGTTNDPVGVYPIEILINIYTNGTITVFGITVPVQTDLYTATGNYESIDGYNIVVNSATGIQTFHQDNFMLFQNIPNPFSKVTDIRFNSPKSTTVEFTVIDMLGRRVYSENISATNGINTFEFNHDMSAGIYMYSINNGIDKISKRMLVTEK
jgi:hypothetical protein